MKCIVQSTLKSLSIGKAIGPDSISNRLLKELAVPLSEPLADLFNFSIRSGKDPKLWKEANISPIYKKDDPSIVSNYIPISLLNTLGKVLEKIVHKHVFNFCRDKSIISTLQSGFVPGDSTVNQLTDIYNTFCKALNEGKEVRAIFCDISKAFDRVWHRGLLYKLRRAGINGSLLHRFSNYLHDRKQRVVLPGATSDWSTIRAGVPQGSILGPLLFLIYINDIVEDIHSSIRLFADDTSLYMDRVKRIWYLSPMRAAKVQASLRIRAVLPEPSLLAHTSNESKGTFRQKARSLASLNGWACAVKVCHDGMLEDTNSLDGAHIIVDDPTESAITLNSDLQKIQKWASEWLVTFNPAKSEALLLSRKINKPYRLPLFFNNEQIQEVNSHKHLGLYFSNDCSWHEHIEHIKTKAWQRINVMRRLKF